MFYTQEQKNILSLLLADRERYHSILISFGDFLEKEILPSARKIDQEELFPRESLNKVRDQKIMSIPFPMQYGGLGFPFPVYIAAVEMLAKACANTAIQVSVQGMVCEGILLFGDERQKKAYLKEKGLVEGRTLAAFALTEPACGSDAKAIQTRAVRSGNSYILNGTKTLITNPGEADVILLFVVTEKGISAFLVPSDAPGFHVMKDIPKLGLKGSRLSAIHLKDCKVEGNNLLGEEGKGLEHAKEILNEGRLTIGAIAVGIAQAAYEKSLSYSKKRNAFGQHIAGFQLVQEKIANMATEITASRLLVYSAAMLREQGKDTASESSQAKLFSTEMALRVCDNALQIHGGYGYVDAYDVHRHWRDARGLTIGEGTSDMLRLLIAHLALKQV
ncbi:MAG TPA: acyl-CoA dehydrogenase family protein [Thermodesulfovibrionales bacterium]|nr:acyl-CoA dehydrogenase family protein [Thermodesulfovibrionales bacterium]